MHKLNLSSIRNPSTLLIECDIGNDVIQHLDLISIMQIEFVKSLLVRQGDVIDRVPFENNIVDHQDRGDTTELRHIKLDALDFGIPRLLGKFIRNLEVVDIVFPS